VPVVGRLDRPTQVMHLAGRVSSLTAWVETEDNGFVRNVHLLAILAGLAVVVLVLYLAGLL
jgi:hypothetical protein